MKVKFKVRDVRKVMSADPKRLGRWDRLVVFEAAGGVIDTVTIPDEEFNEETLRKAVAEALEERAGWLGREFEA